MKCTVLKPKRDIFTTMLMKSIRHYFLNFHHLYSSIGSIREHRVYRYINKIFEHKESTQHVLSVWQIVDSSLFWLHVCNSVQQVHHLGDAHMVQQLKHVKSFNKVQRSFAPYWSATCSHAKVKKTHRTDRLDFMKSNA